MMNDFFHVFVVVVVVCVRSEDILLLRDLSASTKFDSSTLVDALSVDVQTVSLEMRIAIYISQNLCVYSLITHVFCAYCMCAQMFGLVKLYIVSMLCLHFTGQVYNEKEKQNIHSGQLAHTHSVTH